MINNVLLDFVISLLEYDLSEIMSKEKVWEMVTICEELRKESYG